MQQYLLCVLMLVFIQFHLSLFLSPYLFILPYLFISPYLGVLCHFFPFFPLSPNLYISLFPHFSPTFHHTCVHRYQCGVPVIIEGETGVGKTALVKMLSKLWNQAMLLEWERKHSQLLELIKRKLRGIPKDVSDNYQVC